MASKNHKKLPPLPWHGSCQCGQLSYKITAMPLTLYACHCTECRKQAASVHGLSLRTTSSSFETAGNYEIWSRVTDAGNVTDGYFCPDCGSRVWHETAKAHAPSIIPDRKLDEDQSIARDRGISIKAGTLDNIGLLQPAGHIWIKSALPFISFNSDDLLFEGDPGSEGYQQLIRAFARRYSKAFET